VSLSERALSAFGFDALLKVSLRKNGILRVVRHAGACASRWSLSADQATSMHP
jgi:hypothetical protein